MIYLKWSVIVFLSVGLLAQVYLIGKERQPLTPGTVVLNILFSIPVFLAVLL